jgi:hypothetical protein
MTCGDYSCIMDAGPFGAYRSGHSHSDTLSVVARSKESEILIDAAHSPISATPDGETSFVELRHTIRSVWESAIKQRRRPHLPGATRQA